MAIEITLNYESLPRGQAVQARYTLRSSDKIQLSIYDPDRDLVRTLIDNQEMAVGSHTVTWDGLDMDGRRVPDEAYTFVLETRDAAGNVSVYDPFTFSGGEPFNLMADQIRRGPGTLTYKLSQPSRVRIRVGIPEAMLLATPLDWEPRAAGEHTERWSGIDTVSGADLSQIPDVTVLLSYFTLPEATVITRGNTEIDYPTYKATLPNPRPKKPDRPMQNDRQLSPHFLSSRLTDRSFTATLRLPAYDKPGVPANVIPEVRADRIEGLIEVPAADRATVLKDGRFEVLMFLDTLFVAEDEQRILPLRYSWDLKDVPAGERLLTVNVITPADQFGIASRRIRVIK